MIKQTCKLLAILALIIPAIGFGVEDENSAGLFELKLGQEMTTTFKTHRKKLKSYSDEHLDSIMASLVFKRLFKKCLTKTEPKNITTKEKLNLYNNRASYCFVESYSLLPVSFSGDNYDPKKPENMEKLKEIALTTLDELYIERALWPRKYSERLQKRLKSSGYGEWSEKEQTKHSARQK